MNLLAYKTTDPYEKEPEGSYTLPKGQLETSQILFRRLAAKGKIEDSERVSLVDDDKDKKRLGSARTNLTNRNAPSF